FHQAELADVARQRHLRSRDPDGTQRTGQLVLRVQAPRADQLQNLAVAITLVHARSRSNRACASSCARATESEPAPPGISRVFIPSDGRSSAAIPASNSGANAASSAGVQSAGFFALRTLSSTSFPTI